MEKLEKVWNKQIPCQMKVLRRKVKSGKGDIEKIAGNCCFKVNGLGRPLWGDTWTEIARKWGN